MNIRRLVKRALFRVSPKFGGKCVRVVHSVRAFTRVRRYSSASLSRKALGAVSPEWRTRIEDVKSAPDNAHIPRVPSAGVLRDGWITMHNGIEVSALGYYGPGVLNMLIENRGVHEPQEERVFAEILRYVPSGGMMLELGAYWGFYSLWFKKAIQGATCFLVEPDLGNLRSGMANFERNGERAVFEQAYVGSAPAVAPDGIPMVSVDAFCQERAIQHISILHADIQGAEAQMLRGAAEMLGRKGIDFVFISTHSNALHEGCIGLLALYGYEVLAEADLDATYSYDGVVVARCRTLRKPERLELTKKGSGAQCASL
jgi:hypothetical protein